MTPDQIEAAARELCRMWRQDPDEQMGDAGPRWHIVVPEIRRFCEVGTAIATVMQPLSRAEKEKSDERS